MLIRTIPSEPVVVSFVDTETTGLSHRTKYVIEVANLKVVHDKETPWELTELESFEAKLLLPEGVEVSEEARKINGYDPKVWAEQGVDRKDAYRVLIGQLEGSCFGGKNPKFDWMFLDEDFHRLGLSWPEMQHYDLWAVDMLAKPLKLLGFVEKVKQEVLVQFFNIGVQKHTALSDSKQCVELYRRLLWLSCRGFSEENVQDAVDGKLS